MRYSLLLLAFLGTSSLAEASANLRGNGKAEEHRRLVTCKPNGTAAQRKACRDKQDDVDANEDGNLHLQDSTDVGAGKASKSKPSRSRSSRSSDSDEEILANAWKEQGGMDGLKHLGDSNDLNDWNDPLATGGRNRQNSDSRISDREMDILNNAWGNQQTRPRAGQQTRPRANRNRQDSLNPNNQQAYNNAMADRNNGGPVTNPLLRKRKNSNNPLSNPQLDRNDKKLQDKAERQRLARLKRKQDHQAKVAKQENDQKRRDQYAALKKKNQDPALKKKADNLAKLKKKVKKVGDSNWKKYQQAKKELQAEMSAKKYDSNPTYKKIKDKEEEKKKEKEMQAEWDKKEVNSRLKARIKGIGSDEQFKIKVDEKIEEKVVPQLKKILSKSKFAKNLNEHAALEDLVLDDMVNDMAGIKKKQTNAGQANGEAGGGDEDGNEGQGGAEQVLQQIEGMSTPGQQQQQQDAQGTSTNGQQQQQLDGAQQILQDAQGMATNGQQQQQQGGDQQQQQQDDAQKILQDAQGMSTNGQQQDQDDVSVVNNAINQAGEGEAEGQSDNGNAAQLKQQQQDNGDANDANDNVNNNVDNNAPAAFVDQEFTDNQMAQDFEMDNIVAEMATPNGAGRK